MLASLLAERIEACPEKRFGDFLRIRHRTGPAGLERYPCREGPVRSSTTDCGRSPLALPVIGGRGSFASPGSITKLRSSEYHAPFTSGAGARPSSWRTYFP